MANKRNPRHMWTKDDIKTVLKLWDTENSDYICKKLDISYMQLQYITKEIRKAGIPIAKKHSKGNLQGLLKEIKAEIK